MSDALLGLLADIRAAVGDPAGKLMQDELVERCRKLNGAKEASKPQYIFELVDATDPEQYYTKGVFLSYEDARAVIDNHPHPWTISYQCDDDGCATLEIRKRKVDKLSEFLETVYTATWSNEYIEETDELEWKLIRLEGGK